MMDELIAAAKQVRENAYAPYSGYKVGAAVLDEQGRIFAGCNVENISYGATICAERNAVLAMVAAGGRRLRALALVTKDGGTPCGICLQVLAEFAPEGDDLAVIVLNEAGDSNSFTLGDLLPHGFRSQAVARTEQAGR